jgi:predicted branched-subunit amino acid permease
MRLRTILVPATPVALAIGAFGVVFGAAATPTIGLALTVAMSLLVFSGAVQFAVLALLVAGAGAIPILLTALALNARNLVLGAVLRPRLEAGSLRRMVYAWFLVDESFGLALTAGRRAATVLLVSGAMFFLAWQFGTLLGAAGARLVDLEPIASAVFPVLFIGLAAITVRGRSGVIRSIAAAALVAGLTLVVPDVHAFLPILAALAVALVGGGAGE